MPVQWALDTGIELLDARDAGKHPTLSRTAPHIKALLERLVCCLWKASDMYTRPVVSFSGEFSHGGAALCFNNVMVTAPKTSTFCSLRGVLLCNGSASSEQAVLLTARCCQLTNEVRYILQVGPWLLLEVAHEPHCSCRQGPLERESSEHCLSWKPGHWERQPLRAWSSFCYRSWGCLSRAGSSLTPESLALMQLPCTYESLKNRRGREAGLCSQET